jgi:hypothetical protein
MLAVFIYELVVNSRAQGTPVSFKVVARYQLHISISFTKFQPTINPMLGPSSAALINVGARFPPCMKLVEAVPPSLPFGCITRPFEFLNTS